MHSEDNLSVGFLNQHEVNEDFADKINFSDETHLYPDDR